MKSWIADVTRAVKPVLSGHGFARSGRSFQRTSAVGDIAVVEIQKSTDRRGDRERFYVNVGVTPGPWWDWLRHGVDGTGLQIDKPYAMTGVWSERVSPPPDQPAAGPGIPYSTIDARTGAAVQGVWPDPTWVVHDAATAAWIAQRLADELERTVIPRLIVLSEDRSALMREARGTLVDSLQIAFLAESGGGDDMERRLREHLSDRAALPDEERTSRSFARWARDYAIRQATPRIRP